MILVISTGELRDNGVLVHTEGAIATDGVTGWFVSGYFPDIAVEEAKKRVRSGFAWDIETAYKGSKQYLKRAYPELYL